MSKEIVKVRERTLNKTDIKKNSSPVQANWRKGLWKIEIRGVLWRSVDSSCQRSLETEEQKRCRRSKAEEERERKIKLEGKLAGKI